MFDTVDRLKQNKWLVRAIMAVIAVPFAFFGVDTYLTQFGDAGQRVASVGDSTITQAEFGRALQERQEILRRAAQGRADPSLFDNAELRQTTLEMLIQRRLLVDQANNMGLTVPDRQLQAVIAEQPGFRDESGRFSYSFYEQVLRSDGLTPAAFEARLRQDLVLRQLTGGFAESGFAPRTVTGLLARLVSQQREVSHVTLAPDAFLAKVKLDPAAARKHYDANPGEFRVPEQVRVEYVVLSLESLMEGVQADPADVRKYYESNRARFGSEESRQAAHILVSVDKAAGPEAKQKARARAEEIYRELQKKPAGFAEAAKRYSNDPGSAANGGDLGPVGRGTMSDVPEFEKALFALRPGEISAPVETQHGFHIIRLVSIRASQVKPFDEVRGEIEKELKRQLAAKRHAELADGFNNVVYEQSDSLKPAAALTGQPVQQSGWITRQRAEAPLGHPRVLAAIFSDEVLRDKRNTEAIEAGSGTLVAARVIERKPESIQPFEEVRAALERGLTRREAARLAMEEGRRQIEELRQGKAVKLAWSAPQLVSREEAKELPEAVALQALRMDVSKLPAYSGVDTPQGAYILLRVTRVAEAGDIPPEKLKAISERYRSLQGQEAVTAYIAALRKKAGVKVYKEALDKKQ